VQVNIKRQSVKTISIERWVSMLCVLKGSLGDGLREVVQTRLETKKFFVRIIARKHRPILDHQ
jgi:hypothetical protein